MVRFEHKVVDLTYQVDYYTWSEVFLDPRMLSAYTNVDGTHLRTYVEYNNDYILAIL